MGMANPIRTNINGSTLNLGDRVILISARYGISANNPMHGSKEACEGTIAGFVGSIMVKWDNGYTNSYNDNTLQLISRATVSPNLVFKATYPFK